VDSNTGLLRPGFTESSTMLRAANGDQKLEAYVWVNLRQDQSLFVIMLPRLSIDTSQDAKVAKMQLDPFEYSLFQLLATRRHSSHDLSTLSPPYPQSSLGASLDTYQHHSCGAVPQGRRVRFQEEPSDPRFRPRGESNAITTRPRQR